MHPIERLRYVARSGWAGPVSLASEAAYALAELHEHEPAAVLPACRRLLEHNPGCGPLWWVSARLLHGEDMWIEADRCVELLEGDPTDSLLDEYSASRRVVRHGTVAELAAADAVAIEVDALGADGMIVDVDAAKLLEHARQMGIEVIAVAGVGRPMPPRIWSTIASRIPVHDLTAVRTVAGTCGATSPATALAAADCPEPPGLLRGW
ncbi:MAG: hypothetical protein ACYDD4_09030 [Acidimicrobiales bacterium]